MRRGSGTITDVQHHPLGAQADVTRLGVGVVARTDASVLHEYHQPADIHIVKLGTDEFSTKALVLGLLGERELGIALVVGRFFVSVRRNVIEILQRGVVVTVLVFIVSVSLGVRRRRWRVLGLGGGRRGRTVGVVIVR